MTEESDDVVRSMIGTKLSDRFSRHDLPWKSICSQLSIVTGSSRSSVV